MNEKEAQTASVRTFSLSLPSVSAKNSNVADGEEGKGKKKRTKKEREKDAGKCNCAKSMRSSKRFVPSSRRVGQEKAATEERLYCTTPKVQGCALTCESRRTPRKKRQQRAQPAVFGCFFLLCACYVLHCMVFSELLDSTACLGQGRR